MHRCWLGGDAPLACGQPATLSPEESAHAARVLRMKAGDRVELIAAERLYAAELTDVNEKAARVRVLEELPSPEPAVRVTLAQGLPKLDKLEWIVQKATELGAWNILPVQMERSVARLEAKDEHKCERWKRIALEAAKQSGRARVPEILPPSRFETAVIALAQGGFDAVFVAWEEESALRLSEALADLRGQNAMPRNLALVIGPEGGISAQEIERLKAVGARCVSLGRRILRTETAGLCALAVIMSALGEL